MKSDSDSLTMEEGAIENKVEINPEQHLEAGIRPVPNSSDILETTSNQNVKEESSNNPWDVYSIFDFNYFCCPECDFKLKSDFETSAKQDFVNHAISNHPLAVNFLHQISDGSLDDLALPFHGYFHGTKIKEEPLELPESEFDGYCNNFVKTEIAQMVPGEKRKLKRNSKKKKKLKGKIDGYLETKKIKKEQSGEGEDSISMPKEELKCNICGKVYNRAGRLKTHIEFVHEGKKSFVCDRCPRKFISKDSLEYHMAFEHELKELGIDDTNLSDHCDNPKVKELLRKSHNKVQILKKQLCKLCGKEVHGRNTHIREKHSDGNGNYKCPKCDLTFRQYFLG